MMSEGEITTKKRKNKGKKKSIPDGWKDFRAVGDDIASTRMFAFKVPLHDATCQNMTPEDRLTTMDFFTKLQVQKRDLGMVIDLTNTEKYYQASDITDIGVEYVKIFIEGHFIPKPDKVEEFKNVVMDFFRRNKSNKKLIGVHCTQAVNRTGYMVCRYMIDCLKWFPDEAIKAFNTARGHCIFRENYLDDLKIRDPRRPDVTTDIIHQVDRQRNFRDEFSVDASGGFMSGRAAPIPQQLEKHQRKLQRKQNQTPRQQPSVSAAPQDSSMNQAALYVGVGLLLQQMAAMSQGPQGAEIGADMNSSQGQSLSMQNRGNHRRPDQTFMRNTDMPTSDVHEFGYNDSDCSRQMSGRQFQGRGTHARNIAGNDFNGIGNKNVELQARFGRGRRQPENVMFQNNRGRFLHNRGGRGGHFGSPGFQQWGQYNDELSMGFDQGNEQPDLYNSGNDYYPNEFGDSSGNFMHHGNFQDGPRGNSRFHPYNIGNRGAGFRGRGQHNQFRPF
ncbi:RNA/RNP complex-1-interacting phosphatase-like [Ptychodera flava]|uniref:RNA/RNP complex-1-interacting phosphatase-like n=1 Tax=Ptychodera flava TaxID=63121 RepID=UPI00396A09AF